MSDFSRMIVRRTASMGSDAAPHVESEQDCVAAISETLMQARAAVAEYLRDLGLRDPDVIAAESLAIVDRALTEASTTSTTDTSLCERSIRLTVRRLEDLLSAVAGQDDDSPDTVRLGSAIAARLPTLLAQYPEAIGSQEHLDAVSRALTDRITPVVPKPKPRRMGRQVLVLVPSTLTRTIGAVCRFFFGSDSG